MVDIVNDTERDDVLDVKISGKLSQEDYQMLNPRIEEKINQHGKVKMLFELDNVEEVEFGSMWEEMKFDAKHYDDISKIAVVGESNSENLLANIKKPLTSAETKFFKRQDRDAALKWL